MKKKPKRKPKPPSKPALMRSDDLCKELAAFAAFRLHGDTEAQEKVYRAIRQLQLLDAAATEAGILPPAVR